MTVMRNKRSIKDIIWAADMTPFLDTWRSNKNDEAKGMMGSRSYFYSTDTMAYFGCRVAWCDVALDGAAMVALFSQRSGPDNVGRVWSFAIHDFTGRQLVKGNEYASRTRAENALKDSLAGLNARDVVRDALLREREYAGHKTKALSKALRMVPARRSKAQPVTSA